MASKASSLEHRVASIVLALVCVRLAVAAIVPLAFDEAYYWLWSKQLAGGFYDHPPMVAVVIRLGTLLAGDTELGIRIVSILLALPASWAVWRAASILFGNRRIAADAALYFNLTLMVAAGTIVVTPDAPLMVASAFVLLGLAKVVETKAGVWWLAVGLAAGLALVSKYTALFLGAGIAIWLLAVPEQRRWLATPWPYLGGLAALAVFSPVIAWNLAHDNASFAKQFGRAAVHGFTLQYLGELLPAQFGLATPPVFILGSAALVAFLRGQGGPRDGRVLIGALIWPLLAYFTWHSLHDRVQGNWLSPVYPPFAIAAAVAVHGLDWRGRMAGLVRHCARAALPVGILIFAIVAAQAAFGILPLGGDDPTSRKLGAGYREFAGEIDTIRMQVGADGVITSTYADTGWLSFYLPSRPPVVQINDRIRWVNGPAPVAKFWARPLIYVANTKRDNAALLESRFAQVKALGQLPRSRHGLTIDRYAVYLVEGAIGDPLEDPSRRPARAP